MNKLDDGSKTLADAQERARNPAAHSWSMSKGSGALMKDSVDPGEDAAEVTSKRTTLIRLGVDVPDDATDDWIEGAYAQAVGAK